MSNPNTEIKSTEINDDPNDDNKSLASTNSSENANGRLKIDIDDDEDTEPKEKLSPKMEQTVKIKTQPSTPVKDKDPKEEKIREKSELKRELDELNATNFGGSQNSNDSSGQKNKRRKDRGLDGGYWSRMSLDSSDFGRKRRRTTTEFLNLSNLSGQNLNDSYHTDDSKSAGNENDDSQAESIHSKSSKRFPLFKSKSFLAVRADQNSFFLCQACHTIYEDSKKCKIQWLEEADKTKKPIRYKFGYVDWLDPSTIISKVHVHRMGDSQYMTLDDNDLKKVNDLLEKAVKEGGITVDFEEEKDSSPELDEARVNQEAYDKEASSSESEIIKKPKKKRLDEDSDFRPAESDIDEISKPKEVKKKIEEKKPKVEKPVVKQVEKQIEKTLVPNSKSTIQIKKIENKPVKKLEISIVKKSPVVMNGKKKVKESDTDEMESDKETKLKESPMSKKRKLAKIISNRSLQENTKVNVLSTNPLFDDPIDMPFISPLVQSKLAFRYVNLGDSKSLRNLIADTEKVASVHIWKSVFKKWTPAQLALSLENKTSLEILIDDFLSPKPNRVTASDNLFQTFSNGTYNPKSLGISNIRKLTESRGVREGNQAFNKDQDAVRYANKNQFFDSLFQVAFESGCSIDMFKFLLSKWRIVSEASDSDFISYNSRFIYENIYKAVLFGHRKLAAYLIENSPAGHGFNSVHVEVLKAENNSDLKCQLRSNQCTKKPFSNDFITPIHCACINPDVKYLKILISITQNYDIPDKKNRRPVHYAAVCEGMAPLEYLITRVSPYEPDSEGNTPLHYACLADRSINCDILLNFALRKQENDSVQTTDVVIDNRFGLGGINRPNRRGFLPLHLAIQRGSFECVKVLVNYNANLEYSLPNSMDKITPLMYAVQLGNFKIVKYLIEKNAKIEALDRFKRNALVHAAISGSTEILSYLLRLGSNPNFQDSSGNTPLHYAAAYGWFFSVKALIEAGANYNTNNDWKLSPFGAAFLKGHVGICDYLLSLYPGKIDVNFRTEDGESLVMLTVSSVINENTVRQLDYVVNKLNANVKLRDPKGNNAFHYLAANTVECEEYRIKISDILHKAGCNPNLNNNDLVTPFYTSLDYLNFKFARHLIKNLNIKIDSKSKVLSLMADKCAGMDCCHVIFGPEYNDKELFEKFKLQFEDMAKLKDENGYTPFQTACLKMRDYLNSNIEQDLPANLSKFLVFLYKNCKSDPNDLIYEKVESNEEEIDSTKTKYHPVLFNFINEKCLNLFLELTNINQECINFSLCDSDGFNLIQKSISLKRTKFTIQLLELPKLYTTSESLRNLVLNKNESILQLCIKSGEYKVFEYILDMMLRLKNTEADIENFAKLLKHEDKESRNLMHYFSDLNEAISGSFLTSFKTKIEKIFGDCSILCDLCTKTDKFRRQPIHLSLLNENDLDLQFFLSDFSQLDSFDSQNRLALHYLFLSPVNEFNEPRLENNLSQIDPVECLSVLIEKTPKDLIDSKDIYGYTPLHYAAIRGATISCSILTSYNCSILASNLLNNTPLSSAIYFKRESTVLQLLRSDTKTQKFLNEFYHLPKNESKSDTELSCYLLNQPENDFKTNILHLYDLILSYKWDGINWLVLSKLNEYNMTRFDSIESAVLAGEPGLALRLIQKMEREATRDEFESIILGKSNNYFSRTLLMTIAALDWSLVKDKEAVFRLLDKILNLTDKLSSYLLQKDDLGSTAVHYACFMLNFSLLDYLFGSLSLDSSLPQAHFLLADVLDSKSQSAYSLFFWHIGRLKYSDQDFNKIKEYTLKYVFKSREQLAFAFYPLGKNLSFKPEDSVTDKKILDYSTANGGDKINALLYAINRQDFKMCKFLLKELQFDCNTLDSYSVPAIVYAIKVNNLNICNLLLNYDYEVVKPQINFYQPVSNKVARAQLLLNTLKVNEEEDFGSEIDEETEGKNEEQTANDSTIEYNLSSNVKQNKITVKTNIVLDSKDSKSKTIFHHLADPLSYGSFVNKKLANLLFLAYRSNDKYQNLQDFLRRVDSNVKTAVDYAIKNGNWDLYEEFKKILGSRITDFKFKNFEIEDKYFDQITKKPEYKNDSEKFLKNASVSQSLKQKDDYFKVDPLSNMNKICSLVWDEKSRVPYDVILTKTDVTYGQFGMHNFYKMQLFTKSIGDKFDEKQSCILFTRWGRVGDVGMYQRTPFSNFKDAKEEFLKIFKQKTGNDFLETVLEKKKPFESKTRKYNLVKLESRQRPKLNDIKFDLFDFKQQNKDSLFEKSVFKDEINFKHFWDDLLNVGYLKSRIHLIPNLSSDYLPLTQLSDENLQKAYELLDKIRLLIEKRMELEKLSKKDHIIEYINLMDKITILSNDYYELIPQMNFNYEKLKPVSNEEDIEYQTSILNQLTQAQVSCRILMGAKYAMTNPDLSVQNPFDYVYKSLNCKLELLKESDIETQYILRYANSTKGPNCKIRRIFKLKRIDEQNILDKISNRFLLWHGTSVENMISILSRGLVKSPSDSKCNGNRYGKGIYFSDSFQFSSNYSNGIRVTKNGVSYVRNYILLCEVGLGKVKELRTSYETLEKLPEGFDSVKALGRMEPDPNNQIVMPSGCVIPLGDMVQAEYKPGEYIYSRSSNESQYIIYKEKQCSVRYILQFDLLI